MTDAAPPAASAAALPRSHVLNYITTANSPTRVRGLAARCLWILGLFHLFIALLGAAILAWAITDAINDFRTWGGATSLSTYLFSIAWNRGWPEFLAAICYAFTCGIIFCASSRPVRSGRRMAAIVAKIALVPSIPIALFFAAVSAGFAVFAGLGFGDAGRPSFLLLLLPAGLFTLLVLLLGDLIALLTWVSRNPLAEKPPVSFLAVNPHPSHP